MSNSFFDRVKELAEKKGKFKHKTEFIGGGDLSGDIYYHTSKYNYKYKNLKILYEVSAYDDGSGKEEQLEIREKDKGLFGKSWMIYCLWKEGKKVKCFSHLPGEWENKLEAILRPKEDL